MGCVARVRGEGALPWQVFWSQDGAAIVGLNVEMGCLPGGHGVPRRGGMGRWGHARWGHGVGTDVGMVGVPYRVICVVRDARAVWCFERMW